MPRQARDGWRFPWTYRTWWEMLCWKWPLWLTTRSRYIYLYSIAIHNVGKCGMRYSTDSRPHSDMLEGGLPGGENSTFYKIFPAFPAFPALCVHKHIGLGSPHDVWRKSPNLLLSSFDHLYTPAMPPHIVDCNLSPPSCWAQACGKEAWDATV